MRLGASEFGPIALAFLRVGLAALVLVPVLLWQSRADQLRQHWRALAVVGVLNSALPFLAYAYAATVIPGGLASVFNAATPLWGAFIAWLWLRDRPTAAQFVGLALGLCGVLWLAWDRVSAATQGAAWDQLTAVLACLVATLCYGFSANFAKRYLSKTAPMAVAAGSQVAATAALLIPGLAAWPQQAPGPQSWFAVILLGLACTGLAYLLYFRLIAQIGPAKAVTVTFLVPAFAVLWGALFLSEEVTGVMVGACALILAGTPLATGLIKPNRPRRGRQRR